MTNAPLASERLARNLSVLPPTTARSIAAADGAMVQVREDGALLLKRDGGALVACHGRREPAEEARRWLAEQAGEGPAIVIGLAAGYGLDVLALGGGPSRVVAVEPEPALVRWALSRVDCTDLVGTGRLALVVGPEYGAAPEAWRLLDKPGDGEPAVAVHPVVALARPADTARARAVAVRIAYDAKGNREARARSAPLYLENTLRNVATIAREADAATLFGRFEGVPAVLVAAGPSLDRNAPALAPLAGRALVIAVDTAARPLHAAGIRPPVIVGVDPTAQNAAHLVGLPEDDGAWLVAEASLEPRAFASFAGRTFVFNVASHHPWPWLQSIGLERARLVVWGSVLTAAFDLALRAGCDPVVFAGADLAYTGGRPYCCHTTFDETWRLRVRQGESLESIWSEAIEGPNAVDAEDLHGRTVRSARQLIAFRDWLVDQSRAHATRRFVNATGAGTLFGGRIEQATLEAVLGNRRAATPPAREVLALCHRESARRDTRLIARVEEALRQGPPPDVLDAWSAFTSGRTTRQRVEEACSHALVALAEGGGKPAADLRRVGWPHVRPDILEELCTSVAATGREHLPVVPAAEARGLLQQVPDPLTWPAGSRPLDLLDRVPLVPHDLSTDAMVPDGGVGYRFVFRTVAGRSFTFSPLFTRLPLFEDGRPLPLPGASHADIRAHGGGRYSMWTDAVYFSASDGSDPRANGRRYHVLVPEYLHFLERLAPSVIARFGL